MQFQSFSERTHTFFIRSSLPQKCAPNEPGVFIGKILPGNPSRAFLGYVDKKASSKKIVRDVFKKGDSAFLSGDILVADDRGNLFFKDRTGDTFRWKGENVSTSEVEALVSNVAGYRDTVVYGVEVMSCLLIFVSFVIEKHKITC